MNKERVAFIRDRLMVIANDEKACSQFDIDQWVAQPAEPHALPVVDAKAPIEPECGFAGCILGWASHERWFEPWGYKATWNGMSSMHLHRLGQEVAYLSEPERPFADILGVDPCVTNRIIYDTYYEGTDSPINEAIELLTFLLDKGEKAFIDRYVDEGERSEPKVSERFAE